MPIVDEKYVSPTWSNDHGTKINASEMQAITDTIEKNQNEKANKVNGAVEGHLAALDGEGNLTDSGIALSVVNGALNITYEEEI